MSQKVPAADMPTPRILTDSARRAAHRRSPRARRVKNQAFMGLCLAVMCVAVLILVVLLGAIVWRGLGTLSWDFVMNPPHTDPKFAGIHPALWGTVWVCAVCAAAALPLGVATAVFLEEFSPTNPWLRRAHGFVQLNISNLAGVPSVVYGIIGLTTFVWMFGVFGSPNSPLVSWGVKYYDQYFNEAYEVVLVPAASESAEPTPLVDGMQAYRYTLPEWAQSLSTEQQQQVDPVIEPIKLNLVGADEPWPEDPALAHRSVRAGAGSGRIAEQTWYHFQIPFGRSVLAGGLTLMLVVLPIVIIASQESLRAVPDSLREGALAMGATRWQVVRRVTLPAAIPGVMTGSIIAMSRAIGEAAPLLMIAGIVFITNPPSNLMSDFTAMPLQIYNWAQRPQQPFHEIAASGIIVLLAVLLIFNSAAVLIRQFLRKPLS